MMHRRDLLRAGVVLSAGALASPNWGSNWGYCDEEEDPEPLHVGIIGVGLQGRALINAALKMKGIRFCAACDVWEYSQRYVRYYLKNYGHEVTTYADYREMLDNETALDAVIVASPDFVHAEQVNACLNAGRHVYCETMMSDTATGAQSMVDTMRKTGKLLQVGYQRRSNPRYLHAYQKLLKEADLLGHIGQVNTQWVFGLDDDRGWPRRSEIPEDTLRQYGYTDMKQFRNWRWYQKLSGGLFGNLGGHQLDVAHWFLGTPPASVVATGGGQFDAERQWPTNVMALFEFETESGSVQAFCQVLTETRADGSGAHEQFMGSEGSLTMSQNPRWTAIYRDPEAPEWSEWVALNYLKTTEQERQRRSERAASDVAETGLVETYLLPVELHDPVVSPHLRNFFDAVRGKTKLNCPGDIALRSEIAALAAMKAVATQNRERIG